MPSSQRPYSPRHSSLKKASRTGLWFRPRSDAQYSPTRIFPIQLRALRALRKNIPLSFYSIRSGKPRPMVSGSRARAIWKRWVRRKTYVSQDSLSTIRKNLETLRRTATMTDFNSPASLVGAIPTIVYFHQLRIQELEHGAVVLDALLADASSRGLSSSRTSRMSRERRKVELNLGRERKAMTLSKRALHDAQKFRKEEQDMDDVSRHLDNLRAQERRLKKRGDGVPDRLESDILRAEAEHAHISINYHTHELKLAEMNGLFLHGRDVGKIIDDLRAARRSWKELRKLL